MLRAAEEGALRALVFLGVDPLGCFPDTVRTKKALDGMDLVVRTGMFPAGEREEAGFVFPLTAITEADGTYTNVEGRVQRVSKIADPPGSARPNARFLVDLAGRMGTAMGFLTAKDIFEELRTVCPKWSDLSWKGAGKSGGLPLPISGGRDAEEVQRPNGFSYVAYVPSDSCPGPAACSERPWKIFPEERLTHPGYDMISGRSFRLAGFAKEDVARISPADASTIGAGEGQRVALCTDVGRVELRLKFDPAVPRSGLVVPSGGPSYLLERLLSWPEEERLPGWDRIFASVELLEE
jgi:predicted molibdopterin-dependent oxidoreductase YjgC